MNDFERAGRKRLEARAKRLLRLISLNAPSTILAHTVHSIHLAMMMIDSKALYEHARDFELTNLKNRSGYCAADDCDHEIPAEESHYIRCDCCQAKFEKEAEELENSLTDEQKKDLAQLTEIMEDEGEEDDDSDPHLN